MNYAARQPCREEEAVRQCLDECGQGSFYAGALVYDD